MARSLSLKAYMALAARAPQRPEPITVPRPSGELIWGHATSLEKAAALMQLLHRLQLQRPDLALLLTTSDGIPAPDHLRDGMIWQQVPPEYVDHVEHFLSHWQPDLCLWTGGYLRPALVTQTAEEDIPMILLDAEDSGFEEARWRWLPDMSRGLLELFSAYFATNANAAQRLRKLGVAAEEIEVSGPLQQGGTALPCNETEREDMAQDLTGRPVWLAAMVQVEELEVVTNAHRRASRYAPRFLMILVPDDESDGPEMLRRLRADGWRVSVWSEGEGPTETTQILLADTRGEMGLWYRLAPITFMASSLVGGAGGRDPYEPAALGSAVLYGPNIGRYLGAYSRFAAQGAARIVRDAETLAAALGRLMAPDQTATMAAAAWGVATEGAEVTDQVLDLVQDTLDLMEAG